MPGRFENRSILIAALGACALASCGASGDNKAAGVPPRPEVTLVASGAGNCTMMLDGAPVTATALRDDVSTRMAAYRRAMTGYLVNTDIPIPAPNVDAPADMRFACVGQALTAISDGGSLSLQFGRTGVGERVNLASMTETGVAPSDLIRVASDGAITWNNQPIDLAGIRQRAAPWSRGESFPLLVIVAPAPEATVGQVYEVLFLLRAAAPTLAAPGTQIPQPASLPEQNANAQAPADTQASNATAAH